MFWLPARVSAESCVEIREKYADLVGACVVVVRVEVRLFLADMGFREAVRRCRLEGLLRNGEVFERRYE